MRTVCILLSRETHTPISFWLALPLPELDEWYDEMISVMNKLNAKH